MRMKSCPRLASRLLLVSSAGAILCGATAGCEHKQEPVTAPAEIKAAMGGHYSPDVMAQGRAAQASDLQKNAQMIQDKGVAPKPPK